MRRTSLESVYQLAKSDERILFIGSDLGAGVLEQMRLEMPERWFMEGVSEQHIIGMAAGLAMEGFIPYVNTIATFLTRRCFEQLVIDVGLHDLPVRLIGNGGGAVYAPLGPTHQAIDDLAIMRSVPNFTILAPCDANEMRRLMEATPSWPHPIYIRLAKGGDRIISRDDLSCEIGRAVPLRQPGEILLVTTGVMAQRALETADLLYAEGINAGVLHFHTVKPIDKQTLLDFADRVHLIVTLEEHMRDGGLGSAVLECIADHRLVCPPKLARFGLPVRFLENYGSQEEILASCRLDSRSLSDEIKRHFHE